MSIHGHVVAFSCGLHSLPTATGHCSLHRFVDAISPLTRLRPRNTAGQQQSSSSPQNVEALRRDLVVVSHRERATVARLAGDDS